MKNKKLIIAAIVLLLVAVSVCVGLLWSGWLDYWIYGVEIYHQERYFTASEPKVWNQQVTFAVQIGESDRVVEVEGAPLAIEIERVYLNPDEDQKLNERELFLSINIISKELDFDHAAIFDLSKTENQTQIWTYQNGEIVYFSLRGSGGGAFNCKNYLFLVKNDGYYTESSSLELVISGLAVTEYWRK